jgi:nucleotide-binding universal stress UspA family protein
LVAIRKILCPIDFSDTSQVALDYARLLAGKCKAELVVLHVVEEAPLAAAYAGLPEFEITNEMEIAAGKQLKELVGSISSAAQPVRGELVRGSSGKTIVEYAEGSSFDLIVMGMHGRTGLDHAIFGSVTERVMRRAHCPVLIVRKPAEAQPARK